MKVGRSAFYEWQAKPKNVICFEAVVLKAAIKRCYESRRSAAGSRTITHLLRQEGYAVTRYQVMRVMQSMGLKAQQRRAYKATTKRNYRDLASDNLVNMAFDVDQPNKVWGGDITYVRTAEGWLYLAVVMDFYSRQIIGWAADKRMTKALVSRAIIMAYNRRGRPRGVIFHSDRGSQYTAKSFQGMLKQYGVQSSMGSTGACWDNAVVERFFGSLKHEWLYQVFQPTRDHALADIKEYIRYYNLERPHSANGDRSPVDYEFYVGKVSGNG